MAANATVLYRETPSREGGLPLASKDALLSEYTQGQAEVDRLNRQLWTTAQILIPISFAGIGILSSLTTHTPQTFSTILLSATGSSLILWGWYSLARRWLSYQDITQRRMCDIEEELDLWRIRSELYAADKSRGIDRLDEEHAPSEAERMRFGRIAASSIPGGASTRKIIRNVVVLMVAMWFLLAVREGLMLKGFL